MTKYYIFILLLLTIFLSGCNSYNDGSCGSMCVNLKCVENVSKFESSCGYNLLGDLLSPSKEVLVYCSEYCHDKQLELIE